MKTIKNKKKRLLLYFLLSCMFIFIFTSATPNIWIPVEDYGAVGDGITNDQVAIQNAINSGNLVSLSPNKTYLINSSIFIGLGKSLYIPRSSILRFNANGGSYAAIIMSGEGVLSGYGSIESSRYNYSNNQWNSSDPKAAIQITGESVKVDIGYINGFENGFDMGGSNTIVGCNINVGYFINVLYCFLIVPNSNGCVNQNYFHWDITDLNAEGTAFATDNCGIYMDGLGSLNHNTFSGSIEDYYIALKLSGGNNRFLGFRAENCGYSVIINDPGDHSTHFNTIFGEYGEVGGFYSKILNQQTSHNIPYAVQIFGAEGDNWFNKTHSFNYLSYSDSILKKDIQNIDDASNKILSLRGVKYQYKSDDHAKGKEEDRYNYGFIAQELKKVLPELTDQSGIDSLYSINYIAIIPILVEAFKGQKTTIDSLNIRINNLEELFDNKVSLTNNYKSQSRINEDNTEIEIYPNPSNGKFNLRSYNNLLKNIVIFNYSGTIVLEIMNIDSNDYQLNLENLSKGVYFANIRVNNQIVTKKIIIN